MSNLVAAVLIVAVLAVVGCEQEVTRRECTPEQWARVERETLFCKMNTESGGSYCLAQSIRRLCTLKAETSRVKP